LDKSKVTLSVRPSHLNKSKIALCMRPIVTDVLNTKQNRVLDKELDLIARQDDQEVKHKSLTESEDGLNLNSYIY
jgi:hypothetical protein